MTLRITTHDQTTVSTQTEDGGLDSRAVSEDAGVRRTVVSRDQSSETCGCASKVSGVDLTCLVGNAYRSVPGAAPAPTAEPEDCAVLGRIAGTALMTTDFGPLVGPDMYRAGRIAATHAMSDVYAMGGTPLFATATLIVDPSLPASAGSDVLAGMVAASHEDGVELVGGHTVEGKEAMAGLSVIGVAGETLLTKGGARPGDVLMLSKPVGAGLTVRAWRQGIFELADLEDALASMETSNRAAAEAAIAAGAVAATDVTGFGLLGHLAEVLASDRLGAMVSLERVPVIPASTRVPASFARSRWLDNNLDYCRKQMRLIGARDRLRIAPLLDPQTSGGLLVVVPEAGADELRLAGFAAIGTVTIERQLELVA